MPNSQNVLIIGSVWPEPTSSAAGIRMMQLIVLFKNQGWNVTFGSPAADSAHSADLELHSVKRVRVEMNDSTFDVFVRNLQPSIVVFDRFMVEEQFGWRVAEQCPDALRILDTEDLHCLRRQRQKAFRETRKFIEEELLTADVAKREIASILRCDLSFIISGYELELLKKLFNIDPNLLHYLPLLSDKIDETVTNKWPSFNSRTNFITIGNFLHEPNSDSVLYLKEIWPLIRKELPRAELHIYGAYPIPKITQLNNPKEGLIIKGRAEDALKVMRESRVCLAPLRFGAGLKGKLLDAMLSGTPSVTTSIGAEAMHATLNWNGIIADSPAEIADAAVRLYTDENLWAGAQVNGKLIVNQCFLKEKFTGELLIRIAEIQNHLPEHRLNNFTGAMLMHHTMASTKFMSRWIEAKNSRS